MINAIADWLKLVLLAGFAGGALTFIVPEERARLKDYLRLAASLLLLLILLTPILKTLSGKTDLSFNAITTDPALPDRENLHKQTVIQEADKLFRTRVEAIIKNKFPDSNATAIPIYNTTDEEVTLKCIKLYRYGEDGEAIASHLHSLLETEVILCE